VLCWSDEYKYLTRNLLIFRLQGVGGLHLTRRPLTAGPLENGYISVIFDGFPLMEGMPTEVATDQDILISVETQGGGQFKGALIRVEAPSDPSPSFILSPDGPGAQSADVCVLPVMGVTHTTNDGKQDIAGSLYTGTSATILVLDVTVVVENNSVDGSIYYHAQFILETNAPPTAPVSSAPVTAPIPPTPPIPSGTCEVPFSGPDYDIGIDGLEAIETIDTSSCGDGGVTVSMTIGHSGSLEDFGGSLDMLNTYIKVGSNNEEPWLTIVGDKYSTTNEINVASGAALQVRIVGGTTAASEKYFIRDFKVTPTPTSGGCEVPWSGPNFKVTSTGGGGTSTVDTSCVDGIQITFDISNTGSLEASGEGMDTLQVDYQIDSGAVTSIVNALGNGYSTSNEVVLPTSGDSLKIMVAGSTSSGSETYSISNLKITEAS